MCITFMYLYPDIRLMACDSLPIFDTYTERGNRLLFSFFLSFLSSVFVSSFFLSFFLSFFVSEEEEF